MSTQLRSAREVGRRGSLRRVFLLSPRKVFVLFLMLTISLFMFHMFLYFSRHDIFLTISGKPSQSHQRLLGPNAPRGDVRQMGRYIYIYISLSICTYTSMYVRIYIYIYIYTYIQIQAHIYIYILCVCISLSLYIYIYIHTRTICTYTNATFLVYY